MHRRARMLVVPALLACLPACGVRGLQKTIRGHEKEIADLRSLNDTLARQLTESRAEAARLRAGQPPRAAPARRASGPASDSESVRHALAQALAGSGVTVAARGDTVAVSVPAQFESGKAVLTRSGRAVLSRVARALKEHGGRYELGVAGHTDSARILKSSTRRAFPTNWHLSGFRALAALEHLVKASGLPPERFHFRGYGPYRPVAKNDNDEGRAANRRIEIVLEPARQ